MRRPSATDCSPWPAAWRPDAGGPAFADLTVPRRTVYLMSVRTGPSSSASDFGRLFDRADPGSIVARRDESVVAPQALFFLNDPFVNDLARALAARLAREEPMGGERRIRRLYDLALGRPPSPAEIDLGRAVAGRRRGRRPVGTILSGHPQQQRVHLHRLNRRREAATHGRAAMSDRDLPGQGRVAARCCGGPGAGFGSMALAALLADEAAAATPANPLAPRPPHFPGRARRVIFLFMPGGPSQVDTFDPKPRLTADHGKPVAQALPGPAEEPARLPLAVPTVGASRASR